MNWQFWKKQSPASNKFKVYTTPVSLNEKFDDSISSWKEELSYSGAQYRVTPKDTTPNLLSNYNKLSMTISEHSLMREEIRRSIEAEMKQFIMRGTVFKNLYETLDNLREECKEEGLQQFSKTAEKNAKEILKAVYKNFPDYEYYIYPTEDREIAIDCNPQKGKGILILCASNGSVAYFSTLEGKNSRFRCDNIEDFPYKLLWETFSELNERKKYSINKNLTKRASLMSISYKGSFPSKIQDDVIYNSPKGIEYQYA